MSKLFLFSKIATLYARMRFKNSHWLLLLLVGILIRVSTVSADRDTFADAVRTADSLVTLLEKDQQAEQAALKDQSLDQGADLFPVDAEAVEGVRESETVESPYVVITINGAPIPLTDVPLTEWYAPYVRDVADRGLISGYKDAKGIPLGKFGPADPVTIEQLAKMAIEASGKDYQICTGTLKNTTAVGRWSRDYILCAEGLNWAAFSDGSVDVVRPATRAEVVVTILQSFGVKLQPREGNLFTDVDSSTEFAAAIETAARQHLVSGYTDNLGKSTGLFGPTNPVNRAEAAKMFSLAFQLYR